MYDRPACCIVRTRTLESTTAYATYDDQNLMFRATTSLKSHVDLRNLVVVGDYLTTGRSRLYPYDETNKDEDITSVLRSKLFSSYSFRADVIKKQGGGGAKKLKNVPFSPY